MEVVKSERKQSVWFWLLLGFIVIGGIIAYIGLTNTQNAPTRTQHDTTYRETGAVSAYIDFINSDKTMSLDHSYTNGALLRLIDAVSAIAKQRDYNLSNDLEKVKQHANQITQDPFETTHANSIRKAADILSGNMQNIQKAYYPNLKLQYDEVRAAADSINPDVLTLNQKNAVKLFFEKSADLLKNMR